MSRELSKPRPPRYIGLRAWTAPIQKEKISFPAPTLKVLTSFPVEWDLKSSISNGWKRNSYEHFLKGFFKDKEYLFVLKGSSYGRTYWIYRGEEKKPIIKAQNLEQLTVCLKALTAESKGELIEYLIHPNDKLRKLAETKVREFDSI